jgi:phenylalanyl-tRNA synthetase beta chain
VTRTVTGFDPTAPTPDWMARRLEQCGMRPISLAVDITNYVMLELGQPIHGYDADKLAGPIRVRRATAGEKITTLDGVVRTLSAEDLLITDDSGPIGIAGVMGGATTEMSESTTSIVVEAAHFEPSTIFRTGSVATSWAPPRRPSASSAASTRSSRSTPRTGSSSCSSSSAAARRAWRDRRSASPRRGVRSRLPSTCLPGSPAWTSTSETTVAHLEAVGCSVDVAGDNLTATVPPWRPDITTRSTSSRRSRGSSATRTSRRSCRRRLPAAA